MRVPEIEQRLVAKGLSPSLAAAAVNAILEERARASSESSGPSADALTAHRIASAVAACSCLALAYAFGGGLSAGRTTLWLLLPVACIWWAEVLADTAPPSLIRWVAWFVVVVIGGYRLLLLSL